MIRIGVVGAGYWVSKHLRVLHELQGSELYMACDQDQAKLDYVKHYYPKVLTTSDYPEMINSDVDAVVIATPRQELHPPARRTLIVVHLCLPFEPQVLIRLHLSLRFEDGVGFEPTGVLPPLVFKTSAISQTLPPFLGTKN